MIKRLPLLILILFTQGARAQNMDALQYDKLIRALAEAKADTTRALLLAQLSEFHRYRYTDSSYLYGQQALELSRKINYPSGQAQALSVLSHYHFNRGELPEGLELGLQGLSIAKKHNLIYDQGSLLIRIANAYGSLRDFEKALMYYHQAIALMKDAPDPFFYAAAHWRAGDAYAELQQVDSAFFYAKKAEDLAKKMGNQFIQQGVAPTLGFAYGKKGNDSLALKYLRSNRGLNSTIRLAIFFKDRAQYDSALFYANRAYKVSLQYKVKDAESAAATILSELLESSDPKSALKYYKLAVEARESIYGAEKIFSAKSIELEEQQLENDRQLAEIALRNKIRIFTTLAGLLVAMLIALILFWNYRKVRRINGQLEQQKKEINQALADLKKTQSLLIQSEKMASLGELTAGIAHEIQNPLNFVNNFSEVNTELIDELQKEMDKGNLAEAKVISNDIRDNEQKIILHGKRADAIVKGMLQHSRTSSGLKVPTDINALCDEYLRLSYHGLRAKDKNFNANFETDFDSTLERMDVVPQDIGRVILNLINNAFYAVSEKKKSSDLPAGYEPTVRVSTRKSVEKVLISVKDNGIGIPQMILDKIFQPFFTTKPTGHGTGLGLSLSYDIVKAHGGELSVETMEEDGTEFIVTLPG